MRHWLSCSRLEVPTCAIQHFQHFHRVTSPSPQRRCATQTPANESGLIESECAIVALHHPSIQSTRRHRCRPRWQEPPSRNEKLTVSLLGVLAAASTTVASYTLRPADPGDVRAVRSDRRARVLTGRKGFLVAHSTRLCIENNEQGRRRVAGLSVESSFS